jgi:hypothetical protein
MDWCSTQAWMKPPYLILLRVFVFFVVHFLCMNNTKKKGTTAEILPSALATNEPMSELRTVVPVND